MGWNHHLGFLLRKYQNPEDLRIPCVKIFRPPKKCLWNQPHTNKQCRFFSVRPQILFQESITPKWWALQTWHCFFHSHRIHVWYIYLLLADCLEVNVGYMDPMGLEVQTLTGVFERFVSRKDGMNILRVDFNRFWREKSCGFNGWLEFQGFFEYPLLKWVSFVESTPTDSQPFLLIDVSGIRYKTIWGTLRDSPKKYDEIWGYPGILHFISFPSMPREMGGVLLIFYWLGSHGMKIIIITSPLISGWKKQRQTVHPFLRAIFVGELFLHL